MAAGPMARSAPLIPWASRAAGGLGVVTALLYLGLVLGVEQGNALPSAIGWFVAMSGGGLLAWFADRQKPEIGRKMMWAAFAVFFIIGVLSILTIGVLFLIASVLSIFSLSKGTTTKPGVNRSGNG